VAKNPDPKRGAVDADKTGLLSTLVADENEFDRRALFRIGSWGAVAVAAVVAAVTVNQWALGVRREQVAAADLSRQAQQIQALAKESQNETRRLAAAIDTLNGDRDRLFSRVTVLEQGLDSVTGAIAKQNAATQKPAPVASAMPTMMTPPPTVPADASQQAAAAPSPAPGQIAAPPAPVAAVPQADKPRSDAAKPDPASPAPASLPQIAAIKPAVPLPAAQASPAPANAPALGAVKSMMGPPDPAAPRLVEAPKTADVKTADAKSADIKTADAKTADAKTADAKPADPKSGITKNGNAAPAVAAAPTAAAEAVAEAKDKVKPKDQEKPVVDADDAKATVQRTEFAVELGGANSIGGLRALWRGLLKSNSAELGELRPIIVLREGNTGLGMQLRLAAGPLQDAAEAARICASLMETQRTCETTVFDGQRLAMMADEPQAAGAKPSQGARQRSYRRYAPKQSKKEEPPPPPKETSTFSSLFGRK
jgi:hypothetical protein